MPVVGFNFSKCKYVSSYKLHSMFKLKSDIWAKETRDE